METELPTIKRTCREQLARNLSILSATIGKELKLNPQGICAFAYEDITVCKSYLPT